MTATASGSRRWLFGPVPDLLLGAGGLYALVLIVLSVGGGELRERQADFLLPLLFLMLGAPHYGATLLRVYEEREERRRYVFFTVGATLVIVAAFVGGLASSVVASWLVTIYLTWSPWHYTGQNYGIAVLFLRRRGVVVTPKLRRWFHATFILSYALTFLVFHGALDSSPSPEFYRGGTGMFRPLGIPQSLMSVAFPLFLAGYLIAVVGSAGMLLRRASIRDLVPSAMLVLTQALWFAIPVFLHLGQISTGIEPFRWELRYHYFFYVALGHAVQYLWVTTYYAREGQRLHGYARYLGKALVAGAALWTLPVFLFAPNLVGQFPNSMSLAVLVAACVNIHHFILDGAIWKLRHMTIARVLIRPTEDAPAATAERIGRSPWIRRLVWALAGAGFFIAAFQYVHHDILFPRAVQRRDFVAARAILGRLAWVKNVSEGAMQMLETAEHASNAARRQSELRLERSMGLRPGVVAHRRRAEKFEAENDWAGALREYTAALAIDPENPALLRDAGRAALELGEPERARDLLRRALDLRPLDPEFQRELARAERALRENSSGAGS